MGNKRPEPKLVKMTGILDVLNPPDFRVGQWYRSRLGYRPIPGDEPVLRAHHNEDLPMGAIATIPTRLREQWFRQQKLANLLGLMIEADLVLDPEWQPNPEFEETPEDRPYIAVNIVSVMGQTTPPFHVDRQWVSWKGGVRRRRPADADEVVKKMYPGPNDILNVGSSTLAMVIQGECVFAKGQSILWCGPENVGKTHSLIKVARAIQEGGSIDELVLLFGGERGLDLPWYLEGLLPKNLTIFSAPLGCDSEQILLCFELGLLYACHWAAMGKNVAVIVESDTRAEAEYAASLKVEAGKTQPKGLIPEATSMLSKLIAAAGKGENGGSVTMFNSWLANDGRSDELGRKLASWTIATVGFREFSTIPPFGLYMDEPSPGPWITEDRMQKHLNTSARQMARTIGLDGFRRMELVRDRCLRLLASEATVGWDLRLLQELAKVTQERGLPGIFAIEELDNPQWVAEFEDDHVAKPFAEYRAKHGGSITLSGVGQGRKAEEGETLMPGQLRDRLRIPDSRKKKPKRAPAPTVERGQEVATLIRKQERKQKGGAR